MNLTIKLQGMPSLLSDLNAQQQKVVKATEGPVLVLAGAGSGKTRALIYRIAYILEKKIAKPDQIMAVTFTNKAAGEMRARIELLLKGQIALPASLGTFHSLGAKILRQQIRLLPRSRGFIICDADDSLRLVGLAMNELNISRKEHSAQSMYYKVLKSKSRGISPEETVNNKEQESERVAAVYARYEQLLAKSDAYDFEDLLIRPVQLLENYPDVRLFYQNRWPYISVDEYQDTSMMQDRLLKLLVGKEKNICVVGDDYQAIYSWRGAKVDHILKFERSFPGCTTIYLTRNYRSSSQILEAANKIIAENVRQKHKKLWTNRKGGGPVRVVTTQSSRHEAAYVRENVEELVRDGERRRDCVVLYRTNAQSRALEEEFLKYGIPYTIVGGFRFYERREIKDALAFLQFWVNKQSLIAVHRIADALWRGVGKKTLAKWERLAREQKSSLGEIIEKQSEQMPVVQSVIRPYRAAEKKPLPRVSDLLGYLLKHTGYLQWLKKLPDGEERMENIEELYSVTSGYSDVGEFLQEVALLSDIDTLEQEYDRVTCMTLHSAKGLEYRNVYLVGCEEGLIPHTNSLQNEAELEEERRLMYVGMTRAKDRLLITWAKTRFIHGEFVPQSASRFLQDLPDDVVRENEFEKKEDGIIKSIWTSVQRPDNTEEPTVVNVEEGDFVSHKNFGRGVVIGVSGSIATCVFERSGVKEIEASYLNTRESS